MTENGYELIIYLLLFLFGLSLISNYYLKQQIEFIYSEWDRSDKQKDEENYAARHNLPPVPPIGRILPQGIKPIRPRIK